MRCYIFLLSLVLCTNGWRIGFPFQWPPIWYSSWYEGRNHCKVIPNSLGGLNVTCHEHKNTDLVSGNNTNNCTDGCKKRAKREISKDKAYEILEKLLMRIWENIRRTPIPPDVHTLYPLQSRIVDRLSKLSVEFDNAGRPKEILKGLNKNDDFIKKSPRLKRLQDEIDHYVRTLKKEKDDLLKGKKLKSLYDSESFEIPQEALPVKVPNQKQQKNAVTSSRPKAGNTKKESRDNDGVKVSIKNYESINENENPDGYIKALRKRYKLDKKPNMSLPLSERITHTGDRQLDLDYETGSGLQREDRFMSPFETPKQETERLLKARKIIDELNAKKKTASNSRGTSSKERSKSVKKPAKHEEPVDDDDDDDDDNFLVDNVKQSKDFTVGPWTTVDPVSREARDKVVDRFFASFARMKSKRANMALEGVITPGPTQNRTIRINLLNVKEMEEKGVDAIKRTYGPEVHFPDLTEFVQKQRREEKEKAQKKSKNAETVTETVTEKEKVIPKWDRSLPEEYLISKERIDKLLDDEELQDEAVRRFEKGLEKEDEDSERELREKGYIMPDTIPERYKQGKEIPD